MVDEHSKCYGVAWTYLRDAYLDVVYFMGFMGYADPKNILKECLKEGINIKFMSWLPVNDRNSDWEKLRGRW